MAERHDIYLRAYTKPQNEEKTAKKARFEAPPKWADYALLIDCETRLTPDQSLTFGFSRFCALRDEGFVCLEEGIFHADDGLTAGELAELNRLKNNKAETTPDGCHRLRVHSRTKFVEEVLLMAIQAKALIVGLNLPFDLSRPALDWAIAENGGWSLILSQWRDPKTGNLEENSFFPRIVIKSLNSKTAIIQSLQPWKPVNKEEGKSMQAFPAARFLDLRTLLWALYNRSYSLKGACEKFGIPGKLDHRPSGIISRDEIEYCRQDLRATLGLLNAVKKEYDLHPIDPGPDKLFSPASVAKAYLEKLGIAHPSTKVKNANYAYGVCMQAYFGGRSECRIRNWEVPVCPVDFKSQYTTVNELLGSWDLVVAKKVTFEDATNDISKLLPTVTLDKCFQRDSWKDFKFFALIRPEADILPVRTIYNGTTQNIGLNYLTGKEPIWFAGPDIIASILLTGKIPKIEKAIRVVPHGRQSGLKNARLRGMVEVNPRKQSLFKHVVEQRFAHEDNKALYYWLKIFASSGSYGLFVELNPNEAADAEIKVFSGEESFSTTSNVVEEPGKWFAPFIGSLTTSGGRLLLAMLEKCIADAGGTYLFCDTDSAAIVSAKTRQQIPMPDGAAPITALSRKEVENIATRFESLNPYDPEIVSGSILNLHKLNRDSNKQPRQLYGYSIAAKRYALYTRSANDIEIVEPKAHGLGFFYPPKDSPKGWDRDAPLWIFEAWDWILRGVLGLPRKKPTWLDPLPVMMKIALSTPHHVLQNLAKTPLTRPHNFMMIPQLSRFGQPEGIDPNKFTLITSFSSERNEWMRAQCINVHDPQSPVYELTHEYDGKRALVKNFFMLLDSYQNHPEAKSLGPDGQPCGPETRGLLQRAHIIANWPPVYIGKESDKHWEEGEDLSLLDFKAIEYTRKGKAVATKEQLARIQKVPKREFMRRGINQHTLEKLCKRESVRAVKLAECLKVLEEYEATSLQPAMGDLACAPAGSIIGDTCARVGSLNALRPAKDLL